MLKSTVLFLLGISYGFGVVDCPEKFEETMEYSAGNGVQESLGAYPSGRSEITKIPGQINLLDPDFLTDEGKRFIYDAVDSVGLRIHSKEELKNFNIESLVVKAPLTYFPDQTLRNIPKEIAHKLSVELSLNDSIRYQDINLYTPYAKKLIIYSGSINPKEVNFPHLLSCGFTSQYNWEMTQNSNLTHNRCVRTFEWKVIEEKPSLFSSFLSMGGAQIAQQFEKRTHEIRKRIEEYNRSWQGAILEIHGVSK